MDFHSKNKYKELVPPGSLFWSHPFQYISQYAQVYKMHKQAETAENLMKKQRKQDEVRKRREYMRAHGIEHEGPYGMGTVELFRRVIFPGALPSIFVGLRFGLGLMWLTLIVAETIAAQSGLGYMAMPAREFMQTDVIVLAIVIYALLGKLADVVATLGERWLLPWREAVR